MLKDIYDPLTEYINVFSPRFKKVAEDTFAELAAEANVDVESNRETCRKIYSAEDNLCAVKDSITRWKLCKTLLWIIVVGGIISMFIYHKDLQVWGIVILCLTVLSAIILLVLKINPKIKSLKEERDDVLGSIKELKDEAWKQMAPLNQLYDWDVLTRMMTRTVPRLEFDPYFTTQRLADLKHTYNWDDTFNAERSVVYSHSGLINGNPFVICRTRKMEMGTRVYEGSKTIYWNTRERGSNGRFHTVQHSEVLTASVTAPYPEYYEKTRLIYANTAAPDLTFYRTQSGLAGREDSLSFKWKKHSLNRKSRNLENEDFAMLTNQEFEVAFDTSNRNNNQQYALLFTPLAQESMLKLLENDEAAYGDDFDFEKNRMINTIIPNHLQEMHLDMNPAQYRNFDYEKARTDFYNINARHFRAIYFSLAPLLCVPMYQQVRPVSDVYGYEMQRHSSFWEHEALANFWGEEHFKHPDCVTKCILKTVQQNNHNDSSTIKVVAYGYRVVNRVEYISRRGGDGRIHKVPVYWDDYIPVTGQGRIYIQEDNDFNDASVTHRQRLNHISNVLSISNLNIYRKHIASKV